MGGGERESESKGEGGRERGIKRAREEGKNEGGGE